MKIIIVAISFILFAFPQTVRATFGNVSELVVSPGSPSARTVNVEACLDKAHDLILENIFEILIANDLAGFGRLGQTSKKCSQFTKDKKYFYRKEKLSIFNTTKDAILFFYNVLSLMENVKKDLKDEKSRKFMKAWLEWKKKIENLHKKQPIVFLKVLNPNEVSKEFKKVRDQLILKTENANFIKDQEKILNEVKVWISNFSNVFLKYAQQYLKMYLKKIENVLTDYSKYKLELIPSEDPILSSVRLNKLNRLKAKIEKLKTTYDQIKKNFSSSKNFSEIQEMIRKIYLLNIKTRYYYENLLMENCLKRQRPYFIISDNENY